MDKVAYDKYLKSESWAASRALALEHAGYRCVLCGKTENLHVHHNSYDNLPDEDVYDLTVLCSGCHEHYHMWDESN